MTVLFSIRRAHAQNILSGIKTVEYRRRLPVRLASGARVLIYETSPTAMVTGEALVRSIESAPPSVLWETTQSLGGIARELFDDYFANRSMAHAIHLHHVATFDTPRLLADFGIARAPQSFCYLP